MLPTGGDAKFKYNWIEFYSFAIIYGQQTSPVQIRACKLDCNIVILPNIKDDSSAYIAISFA